MTAQRRSWLLRAGMLMAVVVATLGLSGVPAWADALFSVTGPVPATLSDFHPGDSAQNVKFTVTDAGEPTPPTAMNASLTIAGSDFTVAMVGPPSGCSSASSCQFNLPASGSVDLTFAITPADTVSDVPAGTTKAFTATFSVTDGTTPYTTTFNVHLANPAPLSVAGQIYDISTGSAIPGALVNLQDSAAHSWLMTTDSHGNFLFSSTPTKPIVAGQLIIGASKDRYKTITETTTISTKPITNWRVPLKLVVVASPSASPTGTPTPSTSGLVIPSGGTSTDASGGLSTTTDGGLIGQNPTSSDSSLFKYVLIMGVILVVGGAGVIAFMFYRRRRDGADPSPTYAGGGRGNDPGPRGGGRPGYRPVSGAGRGAEATRAGAGDMTMMHSRSAADEFPDPYGAPAAPRGGRPAGTPGASTRRPGGYGPGYEPTQYADAGNGYRPAAQPGYAVDPTGYLPASGQRGYQPTNGYQNPEYPVQPTGYHSSMYVDQGYPSQGYADQGYTARPGYPEQNYSSYQNGYGTSGYDANGYDANGYDANGYDANGYDANGYDANGYNQAGYNAEGYHVAGYTAYPGDFGAPSGGYPQQNGYQQGGYRGGYTPPDQRGSVDWLDD